MNLKKFYHVVIDCRKFGGDRRIVSINKLADYIPKNRVIYILKKLPVQMDFPFTVNVQKQGKVTIYLK